MITLQASPLLSLAGAFARVARREDLHALLSEQIGPLFGADAFRLLELSADQTHYRSFLEACPCGKAQGCPQGTATGPVLQPGPADGYLPVPEALRQRLAAAGPVLLDGEPGSKGCTCFEDGRSAGQTGLRSGMAMPLRAEGQAIGWLHLYAARPGAFPAAQFPLFTTFADLVALAVGNILSSEERLQREREQATLLSISGAISSARNAVELLTVIREKAQALIPFYDTGILIVEPHGQYHYDLSVTKPGWDDSAANQQLHQAGLYRICHPGSYVAYVMELIETAEGPVIEDYQLRHKEFDYPFFPIGEALGYKEAIATQLKSGGKVLGTFWLNSLRKNYFHPKQFEIFQALADQVAVAVANILANEEILQREREKALLLSLSEDMATIRDRDDLFKVIWQKIKPIVGFDDAVISIYAPDFLSYKHFVTASPPERRDHPLYPKIVGVYLPLVGYPDEYVLDQIRKKALLRWDTPEVKSQYPHNPTTEFLLQNGLLYNVYLKLCWAGKVIGYMHFHFSEQEALLESKYDLYKAITDQVAVAVANILANEEILQREREKALLLSLSEDMATIRDRNDLWRVMMEKVKKLVQFDDAVVGVYTNEGKTCNHLLTVSPPGRRSNPHYQQIVNQDIPVDGPIAYLMSKPKYYAFPLQELLEQWPAHPGLLLMAETGLRYTQHVKLNWAGKTLGFVHFHFETLLVPKQIQESLLQSVADQVAVAVANILANEEILEREREKTTLLTISEQLATIRDKQDLFSVMFEKLKPIFKFDDAVIVLFDKHLQFSKHLVSDKTTVPTPTDDLLYQNLFLDKVAIQGTPYEEITHLDKPAVFSLSHWQKTYSHHWGVQLCEKFGLVEEVQLPLKNGGRLIGTLEFHSKERGRFSEGQLPLLRNVADQVAVAVANILANEEILQQKADLEARGREKTLEIALHHLLSEEKDWEGKWFGLARRLEGFIPFDYVVMGLSKGTDWEQACSFERLGREEYRTVHQEDFLRMTRITPEQYRKLLPKPRYEEPFLLNGEDFTRYCTGNGLKALIARTFKVASNLVFPLVLGQEGYLLLSFFSRKQAVYQPQHLELLQRISHSLRLSLEKLLAYQQVAALNEQLSLEKGYLMEEVKTNHNRGHIIGQSLALAQVLQAVRIVAPTDTTVLIEGETGTGKELIARALHEQSPRKAHPLIKINCAALPPQLIESELFGHEKGAFTGALDRRIGKFELAHGGTLFLDEIGELPLELQPKLLRALQEKEIERLGGKTTIPCNVRIVAATNRDLEQEVQQGRFRADLYYRLSVFPLTLPPLRERKEDIPLLALHFAERFTKQMGKAFKGISSRCLELMRTYPWPGNIRELQNVLEQAVIVSQGNLIDCSAYFQGRPARSKPAMDSAAHAVQPRGKTLRDLEAFQEELERAHILAILHQTNGRVRGEGGAAELLDVHPNTLESRMRKLGIGRKHGYFPDKGTANGRT